MGKAIVAMLCNLYLGRNYQALISASCSHQNPAHPTSQPFTTLPETVETTITIPPNTNSGLSQEAIGGIAGVGGVIFWFILIVVLIVSIIIFKRKFKQTSASLLWMREVKRSA